MDLEIELLENETGIQNLTFIKAWLIKKNIEELDIDYKEKEELKNEILKILSTDETKLI